MWCGVGFRLRWRCGRSRVLHHRPVMRLCSDPLQHGSHQGDLHVWQKFQPCSKCLVWIQSNQLLPQHAQKNQEYHAKIFFIFKQTHFTAAKVDKRQNFPGYFFIWYNAIFGTAVWLESVSTWQHYFMLCQEMSIYYFTSTHLSFLFSPNLVITNSPCVLWLVSLLTPTKTASFLPTVRAGLAPNLQLFPPGLLVSESVVKHAD